MVDLTFSGYNIIHILSLFVEILLIIIVLIKGKHLTSNKIIALFFLAQILFSLDEFYNNNLNFDHKDYPYFSYIASPFFTVWGPCMYLYIKSQITVNFTFKKKYFLHFLPLLLMTFYFLFTYHFNDLETKKSLLMSRGIFSCQSNTTYTFLVSTQVLIYTVFSILLLENYSKKIVLETEKTTSILQWNRFVIYGFFIVSIFKNIAFLIFIYSSLRNVTMYLHMSSLLFLIYFSIILAKAALSSHFGDEIKKSRLKQISQEEFKTLKLALEEHMRSKKPFLEFGLTLKTLATQIDTKERVLSKFIKAHYKSSFQDFINKNRIEEAKKIIAANKNSQKTILEVVYESGFNSKSAFNYAFKKYTKLTPTQYKKSLE